jgi:hypothetical protein
MCVSRQNNQGKDQGQAMSNEFDHRRAHSDSQQAQSDTDRAQVDHKRIRNGPSKGAIVLFFVALVTIYMVSYFGARNNTTNSRRSCVNASEDKINYVNNFRVISDADKSVGKLIKDQPAAIASERLAEAVKLSAGILPIDRHIDYTLAKGKNGINGLNDRVDVKTAIKAHYSCVRIWPEPSIWPWE